VLQNRLFKGVFGTRKERVTGKQRQLRSGNAHIILACSLAGKRLDMDT
jgi:hypothetical protein